MLIDGEFKTFGFWLSIISVIGGLGCFIYPLIYGFGDTPIAGQVFYYLVVCILLFGYGYFLYDANIVQVNTESGTIIFKNRFTRKTVTYRFDDFDGKLVWYEPMRFRRVRNFYLIQNKRAIKKLSGFIYSNQKELEEALGDIKDFGTVDYSYLKSWKVFFGYPILD